MCIESSQLRSPGERQFCYMGSGHLYCNSAFAVCRQMTTVEAAAGVIVGLEERGLYVRILAVKGTFLLAAIIK
jgi:hypothetical protein